MIYPKIWSTTLKVFSIVNKMIKKILASRNTYELVNNKTMGVQTSLKIKQKMKKKKFERDREREREGNNFFVWEKNMQKMGENDKFIVIR